MTRNNNTTKLKFHLKKNTEKYRSNFLQRDHCTYYDIIITKELKPKFDLSHPAVFKIHKFLTQKITLF